MHHSASRVRFQIGTNGLTAIISQRKTMYLIWIINRRFGITTQSRANGIQTWLSHGAQF